MKVIFSTEARRDRREAQAYYGAVSRELQHSFQRDLERAVRYLMAYPDGAEVRARGVRAKRLLHFPYTILYRRGGELIFVLALADQRRDPEFYTTRAFGD